MDLDVEDDPTTVDNEWNTRGAAIRRKTKLKLRTTSRTLSGISGRVDDVNEDDSDSDSDDYSKKADVEKQAAIKFAESPYEDSSKVAYEVESQDEESLEVSFSIS